MNGLSFSATTEKRKGILLDPRTKLILLLTITTLMFSTSNEGMILSILVDTFISKISLTMQPGPKIDSISGA